MCRRRCSSRLRGRTSHRIANDEDPPENKEVQDRTGCREHSAKGRAAPTPVACVAASGNGTKKDLPLTDEQVAEFLVGPELGRLAVCSRELAADCDRLCVDVSRTLWVAELPVGLLESGPCLERDAFFALLDNRFDRLAAMAKTRFALKRLVVTRSTKAYWGASLLVSTLLVLLGHLQARDLIPPAGFSIWLDGRGAGQAIIPVDCVARVRSVLPTSLPLSIKFSGQQLVFWDASWHSSDHCGCEGTRRCEWNMPLVDLHFADCYITTKDLHNVLTNLARHTATLRLERTFALADFCTKWRWDTAGGISTIVGCLRAKGILGASVHLVRARALAAGASDGHRCLAVQMVTRSMGVHPGDGVQVFTNNTRI